MEEIMEAILEEKKEAIREAILEAKKEPIVESLWEAKMDTKLGIKKEVKRVIKRKKNLTLQEGPLGANKEVKMEANSKSLPYANREAIPDAKQGAKQTRC